MSVNFEEFLTNVFQIMMEAPSGPEGDSKSVGATITKDGKDYRITVVLEEIK